MSIRPSPTTGATMPDFTDPIDPEWRPPALPADPIWRQPVAPPVLDPVAREVPAGPPTPRTVRMGARLVPLPPVPAGDPLSMLVEPSVAEPHRFCRRCASP